MPEFSPKLRVAVRVRLSGEEPMDGFLLLSPESDFRPGPETILERLNASDRVIPFHRRSDGTTLLLTRLDLEWVVAGRGKGDLSVPPSHFVTHQERVRIRFSGGGEMEGLIQMELPETLNRASDFLNGADDFFPLATVQGIYLVNKTRVLETRLFQSSPLPVAPEAGETGY
ncbi:MAG TPA: hypothetical protein VGK93_02470 [Candidatus Eisenbacteria bacterium]|jgi:hypothetical protein